MRIKNYMENMGNMLNRMKISKKNSLITVLLNVLSILGGILFILIDLHPFFWNIIGIIMLVTLVWNLFFTFLSVNLVNTQDKSGKYLNIFGIFYFLFVIISISGIMLSNLLISVRYSNDNLLFYGIIYGFYFAVYSFGASMGFLGLQTRNRVQLWQKEAQKPSEKKRLGKIGRIIFTLFLFLSFLGGVYCGFAATFGAFFDIIFVPTALAGQFGIFFSVILLANTFLLLRMHWARKKQKRYKVIGLLGVMSSSLLLIPLIATPGAQFSASRNFSNAFGNDWQEKIPENVEEEYFLQSPFTIPQYLLGVSPADCKIGKNITFYQNEDLTLNYDVYFPKEEPTNLPGNGSILIRLHGGGWIMNNKGAGSMLQMNKYFAAQGYVVFDVQYAQYDMELGFRLPNTPEYLLGDYTIDEIVASVGYFTKYIANHTNEYDGDVTTQEPDMNLNSVFVSGGSAGGHLTGALGWRISSEKYTDHFGNNLTIKGLIPFYPANRMMRWFGIEVKDKNLANPENLIDSNSPPCLIYQGTHDILHWFHIPESIKENYENAGRKDCAIIWIPCGGHASDIYFNGYYNLLFLYFIERFIYIYR
ncbi:MAG: alpha/beta hydrolase [Promethearchaeia archaeon]